MEKTIAVRSQLSCSVALYSHLHALKVFLFTYRANPDNSRQLRETRRKVSVHIKGDLIAQKGKKEAFPPTFMGTIKCCSTLQRHIPEREFGGRLTFMLIALSGKYFHRKE